MRALTGLNPEDLQCLEVGEMRRNQVIERNQEMKLTGSIQER
jgi:hypothetical protein